MSRLLGSVATKLYTIALLIVVINVILSFMCRVTSETERDVAADMIAECGYPFEVHNNIETEDGYLLTSQRIPSINKKYTNEERIPVLIMHGLLGSSEHFILNCSHSLGYVLADQGYDVWLGNVRTVSYSRHHITMNPDNSEYWNITLHDFGRYDLPALIDFILKTTGHKQLMYIGHSQGNLIFYIMCSEKPEYADKVQLFVNLSPVVTFKSFPHPWAKTACEYRNTIQFVVKYFGIFEWTLGRNFVRQYGRRMCEIIPSVCNFVVYGFSGYPPLRLPKEEFYQLLRNCPEGIAAKQYLHYCQMILENTFRGWDYGNPETNMVHYGTEEPPSFDLSKTTTPKSVYYCDNDWFLSAEDAVEFIEALPNVIEKNKINVDGFSHFDFILGQLAPKYVHPKIIKLMNKFRSNQKQLLESG